MANRKSLDKRLDFNISTWVSREVKEKLYEIAERENTTVANVARSILEKTLVETEV